MAFLANQAELDAYYLSDPSHPRAAGILWPLILEKRIDQIFEAILRRDEKVKNELFRPSGAMGSYGAKVQLAYLLGWLGPELHSDLITVSKIRNRFAHFIEVKDFSDQKISAWLANLKGATLLPDIIEKAKKDAEKEEEETKLIPVGEPQPLRKKQLILDLYQGMAVDQQFLFRWCIDTMVYQLDIITEDLRKYSEKRMEAQPTAEGNSEAFRVPESWLEKSASPLPQGTPEEGHT